MRCKRITTYWYNNIFIFKPKTNCLFSTLLVFFELASAGAKSKREEIMGVLDYLSNFVDCSHHGTSRHNRRKQLQTVEIKVKFDCEGCVRKVRRAVEGMKGVTQVNIDQKQSKLTVVGYVEPNKVVSRVIRRTGKRAELWPYVPYDVVDHPYAPGVYDKKAPAGYVRNTMDDPRTHNLARASSTEVRYSTAFSDDNANSCTIM